MEASLCPMSFATVPISTTDGNQFRGESMAQVIGADASVNAGSVQCVFPCPVGLFGQKKGCTNFIQRPFLLHIPPSQGIKWGKIGSGCWRAGKTVRMRCAETCRTDVSAEGARHFVYISVPVIRPQAQMTRGQVMRMARHLRDTQRRSALSKASKIDCGRAIHHIAIILD